MVIGKNSNINNMGKKVMNCIKMECFIQGKNFMDFFKIYYFGILKVVKVACFKIFGFGLNRLCYFILIESFFRKDF